MNKRYQNFGKFPLLAVFLASAFCITGKDARADSVILPNYAADTQIHASDGSFNSILRQQTVYAASDFPSYPIVITEIRLRPDLDAAGPVSTTISNLQINFSTTQAKPDQLDFTFSQNTGTDNTLVFNGTLNISSLFTTLGNGTMAFDINVSLQTPFLYDPSKGNLLVDLRNFSGCTPGEGNFINLASSADATSRIYTTDPNGTSASGGDTAGYVLQIIYSGSFAPTITSQPTNRTVAAGGTTTFNVIATPLPLSYQWFFNNTNNPIGGATNSSFTLANAQTNQTGNYSVQVTGTFGSTISSNAALTVTAAPLITSQPMGQAVAAGASAIFTVTVDSIAPLNCQWFFNTNSLISGATNMFLIVTNVQADKVGTYSAHLTNAYGSADSSNVSLSLGTIVPNYSAGSQIHSSDGSFNSIAREQTVYGASEFPSYPIIIRELRLRPDADASGVISTIISNLQINLSTTQAKADQLNFTFAQNAGTDDAVVFNGALDIFSSFITLSNGTKAFDINIPLQTQFFYDPTKGNLLLDLRNFNSCTPSEGNFINLASSADTTSRIYTIDPNGTSASRGDTAGYVLQIIYTPAPLPPTISSQPTNHTVTVGETTTFSVEAGPLPLSYQWFFNGSSNPIDGATNNSLTLVNVQTNQAGNYSVQVTNTFGPTLSSNALLTVTANPPSIILQPVGQTAIVGTNVTFTVSATGPLPLTYQWYFNTNNLIDGATNSSLTFTNIQIDRAGTYSVQVSNPYGSTNSTNAVLTLNFPAAAIRFITTNVMGGNSFDVPVVLVANGNENTLNFSIGFNPQRVTYSSITLGNGASDAGLIPNTSQAASGKIGVSLQLPNNETFAPGTQEVVRVTFLSAILSGATPVTTPINFTNSPINKVLFNAQGVKLATNFFNSTFTISPTDFEGDVTPRPAGDRSLDIFDWAQVGKFVAGIDAPTNASEFQRADCAPKSTSGDGQLKVTDWVQAGRYGGSIDSPTVVGGPASSAAPTVLTGGPRAINIAAGTAIKGLPFTLSVTLQSQGNESGVGFSLNFDPAALKYSGVAKGSAATSASLNINTNQIASGTLGVVLVLPAGNNFAIGVQEMVKITFAALNSVTNSVVAFSSQPVLLAVSDASANELSANYATNSITVNPPPTLGISVTDGSATLSWPAWAAGFNLQATIGELLTTGWTNVPNTTQTNGSDISVTLPIPGQGEYFRLQHP